MRFPRPQDISLPILRGPLRGFQWLPWSGGKTARVLLGTYERQQTRAFVELVGPNSCVLDVGAHVGYYSLLAARLVGERGVVVAFEPNPKNAGFLRRHVVHNRLHQVAVQQLAVGTANGSVGFAAGTGTGTGRVSETGPIRVQMVRLDDFVTTHDIRPTHVKVDIEGGELDMLAGARHVLTRFRPTIFLSTHGPAVHRACSDFLTEMGYALQPIRHEDDLAVATEVLCQPRPMSGVVAA